MKKAEVVDAVNAMTPEQQLAWWHQFGYELTVAARGFMEPGTTEAQGKPLRGFSEIHHRLYQHMRHLSEGTAWQTETALDGMLATAAAYGIESEFQWAAIRAVQQKL